MHGKSPSRFSPLISLSPRSPLSLSLLSSLVFPLRWAPVSLQIVGGRIGTLGPRRAFAAPLVHSGRLSPSERASAGTLVDGHPPPLELPFPPSFPLRHFAFCFLLTWSMELALLYIDGGGKSPGSRRRVLSFSPFAAFSQALLARKQAPMGRSKKRFGWRRRRRMGLRALDGWTLKK